MNRTKFVDMKRGFAELEAFELAEKRSATHSIRLKKLDAIWSLAVEMKIPLISQESDRLLESPWLRLRKAIYERDRANT